MMMIMRLLFLVHSIPLCSYYFVAAVEERSVSIRRVATKDKKLIKIEPHVHTALNEIGLRGESFSQIIERLIKFYKEHHKND